MDIKCIALDMDRTTLNSEGKISVENRKALEYAISKGINIVIASGRSFYTLPKDVLDIQGIEYAITSNGATIYHLPSNQCIHKYKLSKSSIEIILEVTKDELITYEAFINGVAYADLEYVNNPKKYGALDYVIAYIKETRTIKEDIVAFIKDNVNNIESLDIIVDNEDIKQRIWGKLNELDTDIYVTSSFPRLIEISHKDAGKHSGLRYVIEKLGIQKENTAAFGDGDNDVDMINFAAYGIAMENASEKCKLVAKHITKHHDSNGVAHGIYSILKI